MTMQGKRRPDETKPADLEPGDYARYKRTWWVCDPSGAYYPLDERWTVHEHPVTGTINVHPSIDHQSAGGQRSVWHGFLRYGVWVGDEA